MFQIKVEEKIETHFTFSKVFTEKFAVYEIMSKSVVEPERPQAIWLTRVAG